MPRAKYLTFRSKVRLSIGIAVCTSTKLTFFVIASLILWFISQSRYVAAESTKTTPRVAITDFIPAQGRSSSDALRAAFNRDDRVVNVDRDLMLAALTGVGYEGSINLTRDEARRIGGAIGCDFFVLGKAEAVTRSEREGESHEEAYAGVLIVNGRTGALAYFDFLTARSANKADALRVLEAQIERRASFYADQMLGYKSESTAQHSAPSERIEDMPDQSSPRYVGFAAPEFINRIKPVYPAAADQADITATVDALATLRANGEMGEIEIVRWGGFGLEEAADRAIRQLKFKPAKRDGRPIGVRALIRYNFRRVSDPAAAEPPIVQPPPPDKPVPDLRPLFKPTYRRPPGSRDQF